MKAPPNTTRLCEFERHALEEHFVALEPADRRLRFGMAIADEALRAYVSRIDFANDGVYVVRDDRLRVLAAVHAALAGTSAELGLSVLPGFRGQGLGSALFARAVRHLRERGIDEVLVHCIPENAAMMHLARKHRMRVAHHGGERTARLAL